MREAFRRRWINRLIKHNRDNEGDYGERVLLHIWIGLYMGLFPFSGGFNDLFTAYEENEDLHTKDEAWKDYAGAMIGYVIGRTMLWSVVGLGAWYLLKLIVRYL